MIDILGIQGFSFEETATVFKVTGRRTIQIFLHSCIINMKNKQLFNRKKLMFQCVWRKCFAYVRSSVTNISTCFNLYFVKSVRIRSLFFFFHWWIRKRKTVGTKVFVFLMKTLWGFSGPYFLVFRMNTDIQSEYGKMRIRKNSIFAQFPHIASDFDTQWKLHQNNVFPIKFSKTIPVKEQYFEPESKKLPKNVQYTLSLFSLDCSCHYANDSTWMIQKTWEII